MTRLAKEDRKYGWFILLKFFFAAAAFVYGVMLGFQGKLFPCVIFIAMAILNGQSARHSLRRLYADYHDDPVL